MPGGGHLHDMSCNHPGLVNNPWNLDPGCSGTSIQDLPRIFRKSLRKPPESTFSRFPVIRVILDAKMTKKWKSCPRSLFLCSGHFFLLRPLFFVPEHFFSFRSTFFRKTPTSCVFLKKCRNSPFSKKTASVGEFLDIPENSGNSWSSGTFFSGSPPEPRSSGKKQKSPDLGPPCYIYIERALSLYIYTGGIL